MKPGPKGVYPPWCRSLVLLSWCAVLCGSASLFETIRVRYVDERTIDRARPRHLSLLNVSTPAEPQQAR